MGIFDAAAKYGIRISACHSEDLVQHIKTHKVQTGQGLVILSYSMIISVKAMHELGSCGLIPNRDVQMLYFGDDKIYDDQLDKLMRVIVLPEYEVGVGAVQMLQRRMEFGEQPSEKILIDMSKQYFYNVLEKQDEI